ncbi:glycosyltransferase [archaeon]|nr:glycosyltransferase [archaeon]|tara:strand:- start:958 stop:1884 length:927 start_codon:yes stop_codon:yes gene_type:complete
MVSVSIVFPVFNEEESLIPLVNRTLSAVSLITKDFEIVFVDDGSTDKSLKVMKQLSKKYKKIKYYGLKKNMGKASALYVGFQKAEKDYVITMDSDLQDDPGEMGKLVEKLEEGYDFVNGWKKNKHKEEFSLKRFSSRIYNNLNYLLTGIDLHDFNCPFKAYKKQVAKDLFLYGDLHRYIPMQVKEMGHRYTEVVVENYPRKFGYTKYGKKRIVKGFLDLITIKYLITYKNSPLHVFGVLGLTAGAIGMLLNLYLFFIWLTGVSIGGRPLLFLAILLTILGLQFISLGLIGEMITNNVQRDADVLIRED